MVITKATSTQATRAALKASPPTWKEPLQSWETMLIRIACSIQMTCSSNRRWRRRRLQLQGIVSGSRMLQRFLRCRLAIRTRNIIQLEARSNRRNLKRTRTCSITSTRRWRQEIQGKWNSIKPMVSNWFISQAIINMTMLQPTTKLQRETTSLCSKRSNNKRCQGPGRDNWNSRATKVLQNAMSRSSKTSWDPCPISM